VLSKREVVFPRTYYCRDFLNKQETWKLSVFKRKGGKERRLGRKVDTHLKALPSASSKTHVPCSCRLRSSVA